MNKIAKINLLEKSVPNEKNHRDDIENALHTFQKTIHNDLHARIMTDESQGPQDP